MSEISEVKKILRSQIRAALRELTQEERDWSDRELCQQFLQHPVLEKAQTILMYYGVGTEIRTDAILEELLKQGKTVCMPRCLSDTEMKAYVITGMEDMEPDRYNIPAPKLTCPVVESKDIDLILTPGLCFDSRGGRLGQGAGYYDRYLEDYEGVTVGLCREDFFQINLPKEPLDMWVKYVITEEGQVWPHKKD